MALLWAEGFDHYGTSPNGGRDNMLLGAWAAFSAGNGTLPVISAGQQRTGPYSLLISHNYLATAGVTARRVLGSTHLVAGAGMGLYMPSLPPVNNKLGFEFRDGTNANVVRIAVQTDGAIGVYLGAAGASYIGASDPILTAGAWNHIEVKVAVDSIVGSVEVRVNNVAVFNMTDLDTGSAPLTQMFYGTFDSGGPSSFTAYFDDLFTWDDSGTENIDFLGQQRVETIYPTSDTAQADWTIVGAADGFDCIDDTVPDGDTTYISGTAAAQVSEFGLDSLPPETDAIAGVFIPVFAKLADAGTGNIQVSLVTGANVSLGPDQVLTSAYQYWGGVHEVDPTTGVAWTKAGLEAALLRVEKTV